MAERVMAQFAIDLLMCLFAIFLIIFFARGINNN
jgi:hypothetical protein